MPTLSERRVVFLVGAVQFVNILDFTMVMPLGPDFAAELGIPLSQIGLLAGAYAASAAVVGLLASFFLDRFDRRSALAVAMLGLGLGTAAGGLCTGFRSMLAARLVAGLFGGPATSLALAIIADVIPRERRGKALGAVAGALSVAQVLGIPLGLRLARMSSWRLPFFVVAVLGELVTLSAIALLPRLRGHLAARAASGPGPSLRALLSRPIVLLSYSMTAVVMAAGFLLLPNVPAFVQGNLGYPRARLELLYATGGAATFVTNRLFGRLVDRLGSFRVGLGAAIAIAAVSVLLFAPPVAGLPVLPLFVGLAVTLGARNVAYNVLTNQVPRPDERARFLSLQSTVYHLASALGATTSAHLLWANPDRSLGGMGRVLAVSLVLTALFPVIARAVERRLLGEAAAAARGD